jgi:hypothetical protein
MNFWKRAMWAAAWMVLLMVVTIALSILLTLAGYERAWAEAEGKYWFGLGMGLVIGRYFWWHERFPA